MTVNFGHFMYFMLKKVLLHYEKANFFLSFTSILLVFRKFLETIRDFILKRIPMFVKLLSVPINHEHRNCIVHAPLKHSHVDYQI
jgi:hypothetical protein